MLGNSLTAITDNTLLFQSALKVKTHLYAKMFNSADYVTNPLLRFVDFQRLTYGALKLCSSSSTVIIVVVIIIILAWIDLVHTYDFLLTFLSAFRFHDIAIYSPKIANNVLN